MTLTNAQEGTGPPENDDGPGSQSGATSAATAAKRLDNPDDTESPPEPPPLIDQWEARADPRTLPEEQVVDALTDIGEAARAA